MSTSLKQYVFFSLFRKFAESKPMLEEKWGWIVWSFLNMLRKTRRVNEEVEEKKSCHLCWIRSFLLLLFFFCAFENWVLLLLLLFFFSILQSTQTRFDGERKSFERDFELFSSMSNMKSFYFMFEAEEDTMQCKNVICWWEKKVDSQ